jgi:hypothetical protein
VFARRVDDEVGRRGTVIGQFVHVAGARLEAALLDGPPVDRIGHRGAIGIEIEADDPADLEACIVEQHGGQHAVPAADDPDGAEAAAEAAGEFVAQPGLAGDLPVPQRLGDVVVGMADHRFGQIADEAAAGILRQTAQDVEGEVGVRDITRRDRHEGLDAGDGAGDGAAQPLYACGCLEAIAVLTTMTSPASEDIEIPHLAGPAAMVRQVVAAHFVSDCRTSWRSAGICAP